MQLFLKTKSVHIFFVQTTTLFLLLGKLTSMKLWLTTRFFPTAPVFDFLYQIPGFIHLSLYVASLLLLAFCIIKPRFNKIIPIIIILEIASCLLDQNRCQPWEYQYVFMLFVLWYNKEDEGQILFFMLIIFSFIYFYSGLQKMNPHFLKLVWKQLLLEQYLHLPSHISNNTNLLRAGYLIPLSEFAAGIFMLIKRTRRRAIIYQILMHIFLLTVVGPWCVNENATVFVWNIAMIVLLGFLLKKDINVLTSLSKITKPNFNWITILAWIVMPAFNFLGYWDFMFSSSLYSGRIDLCFIKIISPPADFELKKFYKTGALYDTAAVKTIAVQNWALEELDTPPCPQERVYKKMKLQMQQKYPSIIMRFYCIDRTRIKYVTKEL